MAFSEHLLDSSEIVLKGGVGGYSAKSSSGYSGYLGASVIGKKHTLHFRFLGAAEGNPTSSPAESFKDLGILYGRYAAFDKVRLTGMVGLGFLSGLRRGKFLYTDSPGYIQLMESTILHHYKEVSFRTLGIPLEGDISFRITPRFNLAMCLTSNINTEISYLGFSLNLEIIN